MCVKCHMDRELPYGRKDFLRYIIRIPLLHILVNSLLCSANTTAKEVIFMNFSSVDVIWTLLGAALVYFMQAGFAMCEAVLLLESLIR